MPFEMHDLSKHNAWIRIIMYLKYKMLRHPLAPQKLIHSLTNTPQMNTAKNMYWSTCHSLDTKIVNFTQQ